MIHCALAQFGFCCGYLVFLSNTLGDLHWLPGAGTGAGWDLSSRRVLLFAVPLAAFALLRDLRCEH